MLTKYTIDSILSDQWFNFASMCLFVEEENVAHVTASWAWVPQFPRSAPDNITGAGEHQTSSRLLHCHRKQVNFVQQVPDI